MCMNSSILLRSCLVHPMYRTGQFKEPFGATLIDRMASMYIRASSAYHFHPPPSTKPTVGEVAFTPITHCLESRKKRRLEIYCPRFLAPEGRDGSQARKSLEG